MIQDYDIKKHITTHGDTATLFLGLKAENIPVKDAVETESEFTRFLSRVTGKQIVTTAKPSETRTIIWITDETETVKDAASVEDAWQAYHRKFPSSQRSRDAVKKKWFELHKTPAPADKPTDGLPTCDEETGCAGCPEKGLTDACEKCSPPPKTPADGSAGRRKGNKYGIPNELKKTDKKLFDRLWQRCKSHGITYEEAVKLKPSKPGRKPKTLEEPDPTESKPRKTAVRKPRLPYKLKNQKPAPVEEEPVTTRYAGDELQDPADAPLDPPHQDELETYTVKGLDQDLADALPEQRPPTGPQEKREAAKTVENLKIGDKVRQIGGLKICHGVGEVKRAPPGNPEVLVGFPNGQEWINRKNLAPVMA